MTKTGKKKKSLEGGEAVVTRTKKTKKTKKSDEKENHISVVSNSKSFMKLSSKLLFRLTCLVTQDNKKCVIFFNVL